MPVALKEGEDLSLILLTRKLTNNYELLLQYLFLLNKYANK